MKIRNYFTRPDRRPPKSKDRGEIEEILRKSSLAPLNAVANICGAKIELRTDSKHVYQYWCLNWEIVQDPADGVIWVINGVEGYDPHLFYNLETKTILIVNSEYYGAVKSAGALGLAGVILKKKYPIHGACVGYGDWVYGDWMNGVIIIAPIGTGKTTQSHELLYSVPGTKVHSDDYVFASFFEGLPVACATEMQLYMRTDIAKGHPTFIPRFEKLPNENVRDNCYWAYGNSRVMFPRHMFPCMVKDKIGRLIEQEKGEENVTNRAIIRYIFLLTRDKDTPPVTMLSLEKAIEVLKEGKYTIRPGAGPEEKWGAIGYEPWYNPYPPEIDSDRQEKFFGKLYRCGVRYYLLNTGSYKGVNIQPHQTHMYIRHILQV